MIEKLLLRAPWLSWVGPLVLVSLVAWAGWTVNGWRQDAARLQVERDQHEQYVGQVAERDRKALDQFHDEQARAERLAGELGQLRNEFTELAFAAARAPTITRTEVKPNENGKCTVITRGPAHRVCVDAAWSRDPALIAACKAYGGDAARR